MLIAERREDPKTKRLIPTGRVFDHSGAEVQPAYWLGKYSDMPHILSFLNESYQTSFEVLQTDNEVAPLLGPFQTAFANKMCIRDRDDTRGRHRLLNPKLRRGRGTTSQDDGYGNHGDRDEIT